MRTTRWLGTVLIGAACALPCQAAEPLSGPAARLDAQLEAMLERGELFKGLVTEQDVSLFFTHLKTVLLAASTGREPPPPSGELNRRAEEIGKELKARGMLAGLLLLSVLEAQARELVRETPPRSAPPTVRPPNQQ